MTNLEQYFKSRHFTEEDKTPENIQGIREHLKRLGKNPDDEFVFSGDFTPFTCSICGSVIDFEYSNNAQPVNDGRCCNFCNDSVVIPARLKEV